jgi:signal transduction histidine kinase
MSDSSNHREQFEAVFDRMPTALVLVEVGTSRVIFANAPAQRIPFAYASADVHNNEEGEAISYATDERGERLTSSAVPRAKAARGEKLDGVLIDWHTPAGLISLLVHIDVIEGDADATGERGALSMVTFQDVTELQTSKAQLRRALAARDELISIAAHELRSPITSLQLVLQRMYRSAKRRDERSPEQLGRQLEPALRQLERLKLLIQNLLDVTRVKNDRLQLDREPVDLRAVVSELADGFAEQARVLGSSLNVSAPRSVEGLWDRTRIEQVITNLVSNAFKYGDSKPIDLSLDTRGDVAVITVKDRGIGLAEDQQERIFAPFERAASAHQAQSLGLGLYIVREIARAHGGDVRVTSRLGEGSTFTVELPILSPSSAPHAGDAAGGQEDGRDVSR